MSLMEDDGDSHLKLMLLTKREGQTFFQIRSYPSFAMLYELKVNDYCVMLDSFVNQGNPVIVEGSHLGSGNDVITSNDVTSAAAAAVGVLRLRSICEGNPKARLERLLRRQKFEEAEKLAK